MASDLALPVIPKWSAGRIQRDARRTAPTKRSKLIQGQLRRNPRGFAFVDDAFVAPPLVESVGTAIEDVVAIGRLRKHPKDKRTWRVIALKRRHEHVSLVSVYGLSGLTGCSVVKAHKISRYVDNKMSHASEKKLILPPTGHQATSPSTTWSVRPA